MQALLRRFVGPAGLPRDAAGAALARLLSKPDASSRQASRAPASPPGGARQWSMTLERWLQDQLAPEFATVPASDLLRHRDALQAAIAEAMSGTRPERAAVQRAMHACSGDASQGHGTAFCLQPLSDSTVWLAIDN